MYTVIIVDDDQWALTDIRHSFQFEKWGFEIKGEFENAESAFAAILADPPDLVLTDICMALQSGLDLARSCREHGIASLIVLVSGYERFAYAREALQWGVFDYLLKPLASAQVDLLMQRVLLALNQVQTSQEKHYSDDTFGRMLKYIDTHYTQALPLDEVADKLFTNRNYLSELFSHRMGVTFTHYKKLLRIKKAREMIDGGCRNMTDIALACGFDSASTFSRVFKQIVGHSPMVYRAKSQASGADADAEESRNEDA